MGQRHRCDKPWAQGRRPTTPDNHSSAVPPYPTTVRNPECSTAALQNVFKVNPIIKREIRVTQPWDRAQGTLHLHNGKPEMPVVYWENQFCIFLIFPQVQGLHFCRGVPFVWLVISWQSEMVSLQGALPGNPIWHPTIPVYMRTSVCIHTHTPICILIKYNICIHKYICIHIKIDSACIHRLHI